MLTTLLTLTALSGAGNPAPASAQDLFGDHWHDGRAEVAGYRWSGSRYGASRSGECIMVFVTESFSASKLVKLDAPGRTPDDAIDVLKLNLVRDFQTGVYDYNTMTSVFARTNDFAPLKITFSSAEWCGHVFEQMLFRPPQIELSTFSYFEGESARRDLDAPDGGIVEDELFIRLRGLRRAFLEPREETEVPFLAGSFQRRLFHRPATWGTARIRRDEDHGPVDVPAGEFVTHVYRVAASDGREGTFWIEREYPHRIVRWTWMQRDVELERGELTGSARMRYWALHGEGDESYRRQIGLDARDG